MDRLHCNIVYIIRFERSDEFGLKLRLAIDNLQKQNPRILFSVTE